MLTGPACIPDLRYLLLGGQLTFPLEDILNAPELARIRFQELLTEDKFTRFSPETRASVQVLLEMWRT
jgi:hypothetical protein